MHRHNLMEVIDEIMHFWLCAKYLLDNVFLFFCGMKPIGCLTME